MEEVNSKYTGNITSSTTTLSGITSKKELDIQSKTELNVVSIAKQAPGASDIIAASGAFSACKVSNWKASKESILRNSL